MPTTVTSTIGTAARDYSTLQAWEDASPADLVSDDKIWRGEAYNDSEFTAGSGTLLTVSGITVDSTRYVELTAASGQSFQDHADVRTNAVTYNQALGVGIRATAAYVQTLAGNNFFRTSRCQWSSLANSVGFVSGSNARVKDTLVFSTGASCDALAGATFINVVRIFNKATSGNGFESQSATFIGCTVLRPSDQAAGGRGWSAPYATVTIQSCACFGFTTIVGGNGSGTSNTKFNATDQASFPGTDNQVSVTYSQTTPFTDADKDSLNLIAIAATSLAANGFLDSTNAPNDISGYIRPASPTIGHWQITAAAFVAFRRPGGRPYPFAPGSAPQRT